MTGVSSAHFPVRGRTSSRARRQIGTSGAFTREMGDVISLSEVRAARAESRGAGPAHSGRAPRVTFFFDLVSPWTYLAAERAERLFAGDRWRPATGDAIAGGRTAPDPRDEAERAAAERRAKALRLPLVWPEGWPDSGRGAMRVAALAAERGRAAPFVLAASRLAFCGGYELDDPEVIAEAAAAAGLALDDALRAAGEVRRDGAMDRTALRLLRRGADELPAVTVGRQLFAGEGRLAEAAAAAIAPPPVRRRRAARPG
jgi:2-hydroxychromene-2-carboxylate isomerase